MLNQLENLTTEQREKSRKSPEQSCIKQSFVLKAADLERIPNWSDFVICLNAHGPETNIALLLFSPPPYLNILTTLNCNMKGLIIDFQAVWSVRTPISIVLPLKPICNHSFGIDYRRKPLLCIRYMYTGMYVAKKMFAWRMS